METRLTPALAALVTAGVTVLVAVLPAPSAVAAGGPAAATDAAPTRDAAAAAAARSIATTRWNPQPVCDGDVCSGSSTDDIPRIQVNGQRFTVNGKVTVKFVRTRDSRLLRTHIVTAKAMAGRTGGAFTLKSTLFDCSFDRRTPVNSYVQAYDQRTRRWSARVSIRTGCAVQ
jgi:hypothetical protein